MEFEFIKNKLPHYGLLSLFIFFAGWWFFAVSFNINPHDGAQQLWGATYQLLAFYGAVIGIFTAKKWGGHRSTIGKMILAFSAGLFLQCFGQTVYSYNLFKTGEILYPSIGDVGFFGSALFYIYGVALLAKSSGIEFSLEKIKDKLWALCLFAVIVASSYIFLLRNYHFDFTHVLKICLDFGYPLSQASYVSIAVLSFLASKNLRGGIMRKPIMLLIFALVFQYASDYTFLYVSNKGIYTPGGFIDLMYMTSYFAMSFCLINFQETFELLKTVSEPIAAVTLSEIAVRIIRAQESIIGPLAWDQARTVPGLYIDNSDNMALSGDEREIINRLVIQYGKMFGQVSYKVCKKVVQDLLPKLAPDNIPPIFKKDVTFSGKKIPEKMYEKNAQITVELQKTQKNLAVEKDLRVKLAQKSMEMVKKVEDIINK
jgi:hypothetical protein